MSIITPRGFLAAGIACGIKDGKKDLAIISTDSPTVTCAGVFTSNLAAAAPVQISKKHLLSGNSNPRAVIINSGNANAATGKQGYQTAEAICERVAKELGCSVEEVLICSTGIIGTPLPKDKVIDAVPKLVNSMGPTPQHGLDAANAILTTDTFVKQAVIDKGSYSVAAMAKGAAMLAPNMATMLAFITTDAKVSTPDLFSALKYGVNRSFNSLSVDGCTSTNDTVLAFASGQSSTEPTVEELGEVFEQLCQDLAIQMMNDAEGATKVLEVKVFGAIDDTQAFKAAQKVANSLLVKCSLYGQDPYWGRVVSELGSAGIDFNIDLVSISYGSSQVCKSGQKASFDPEIVKEYMSNKIITITINLNLGQGVARFLGCDLGPGYIEENQGTS